MNIQDIKIGDLLTVWDALEGDSVGRIIEIIPSSKYCHGYAVKVELLFGRNLKPMSRYSYLDTENIQPLKIALEKAENNIKKLQENLDRCKELCQCRN